MATDAEKAKAEAERVSKYAVSRATMHRKVADGIERGIQIVKVATARLSERLDAHHQLGVDLALANLREVRDTLRGQDTDTTEADDEGEGDKP